MAALGYGGPQSIAATLPDAPKVKVRGKSFTFDTISIFSISHYIFPLNISVLFSLCARLN